jgi:hypothetical protein
MKIRTAEGVLPLPTGTTPDPISNASSQSLVLYADNLLDAQIFTEIVTLLNSKKISSVEMIEELQKCNLKS